MPLRDEDKKFQLKMLELQIRHQHKASILTVLLAVEFSLFFSMSSTLLGVYVITQRPVWVDLALVVVGVGAVFAFITALEYLRTIKSLKKEIQNLRKKFIW